MTTATRPIPIVIEPANAGVGTLAPPRAVAVRWPLGVDGLESIQWRLEGGERGVVRATAQRVGSGGAQTLLQMSVEADGLWHVDADRGLVHADIPGLLSLTLARTESGDAGPAWALRYARTSVLDTLSLSGGQADEPVMAPE